MDITILIWSGMEHCGKVALGISHTVDKEDIAATSRISENKVLGNEEYRVSFIEYFVC